MHIKTKPTTRNCALNLLARREHSTRELKNKLLKREFSNEQIQQAITKLQQEGLQSDQRFAEAYIHMRTNRGYGPYRIQMELLERGVAEQLIEQLLQIDDETWQERIVKVWQKKFHSCYPTNPMEYKKQLDFLQYRGFGLKQINRLLKGKLAE